MFLPKRDTGGPLGLPFCFARCVGFIEMLELLTDALPVGGSPSRVPFIEMLECTHCHHRHRHSPSGVPFIEMLEYPPLKKPI